VATTTIRVDNETHAELVDLSRRSGASLLQTVREAAEALRRQRFAEETVRKLDVLRADPAAWADYLAEGESTHAGRPSSSARRRPSVPGSPT
jgi:hypothetical protein